MVFPLRSIASHEMRLLAELGPLTLAGGGWLMAQASGLDPSLANLIGNGVTVAVLCWYVVYDIRVRTPNMLNAFTTEQDEIRKAFKEEQKGSRETFKTEQKESRQNFTVMLDTIMRENRDEQRQVREKHSEEIAEWRKMVLDNMHAMRTAVHDVKDTAQLAINRGDLAATVPKRTADSEGGHQPSRPS